MTKFCDAKNVKNVDFEKAFPKTSERLLYKPSQLKHSKIYQINVLL